MLKIGFHRSKCIIYLNQLREGSLTQGLPFLSIGIHSLLWTTKTIELCSCLLSFYSKSLTFYLWNLSVKPNPYQFNLCLLVGFGHYLYAWVGFGLMMEAEAGVRCFSACSASPKKFIQDLGEINHVKNVQNGCGQHDARDECFSNV